MRDEAALLRLLKKRPDDLDALLVYADLLDEQGDDARAEFLRLQRRLLDMRHGARGLIGQSRQLVKLGKKLPADWLDVVSRPRLGGTCWAGRDSAGRLYVFRYLAGGELNYTSPSGTFQNGTWRQVGNHVAMEMNRHFADYEGFVAGGQVRGTARNVAGGSWRWEATRTTDPELCDVGDPVMTIFDSHTRRRGRRAGAPPPPTSARRRRSPGSGP
jgi:uncharacterized protein (TIGR02996 family)